MKLKHRMIAIAALLSVSTIVFAKEISLYDQPKTDAKVIGTIDLAKGIVPIFTPKEGGWVKVGDPNNGNVGWIKANELNTDANSITMTQEFISTDQGPKKYIVKFGAPQNLTPEQIKEIKRREQLLQQSIQNMSESINRYFRETWQMPVTFPVVMPVVVMPQEKTAPVQPSTAKPAASVPKADTQK